MILREQTQQLLFGLEMEELLNIILEWFRNWLLCCPGSQIWCPNSHADTQLDHGQFRDGL